MTNKVQDKFFVEIMNRILEDTKECAEYIKNQESEEYKEIKEDYDYEIQELTEILNTISGIDDVAEMEDDIIQDVYEYLQLYASNFYISEEPVQKKKDLKEYKKIEEILNLFFDEDDFDYDE